MDVQTENVDPPPCESQPSGKIRKGFKLFGKRKPGNIFSIRSKGDGNNKSPIARSKTLDGLTESTAQEMEQEPEKKKEQEVSQGESGQAEEEPLGEDGVLAAAPPRTSICSTTSAKSLGFLSLLRGGRRGGGDRQVQTLSQPAGRQRRGLMGLFGNVKFRQRDKEGKEEAPPSPLLMSSRTNSVEIIKEDLTLTPKSQPRSLDSPDSESCEPLKSVTTQDSSATSPSETIAPQMTAGNVSKTNEHAPPLPTTEPPLVPGETSLSSLLADISSLLTFDSISAGGDIIADVEAEWGKASRAISAAGTEDQPSSKTPSPEPISSSLTFTPSLSTTTSAKPPPFAARTTASFQSFTPATKPTMVSSPITKPSSFITFSTKSSTLTAQTVKSGSDLTPTTTAPITIKSTPLSAATTKPSTSFVTVASFSTPLMSSPPITMKPTPFSTSVITTATAKPPATVFKTFSVGPTLTSTAGKSATEITAVTQITATVSKPGPVTTPPPASTKPTAVTHSPPTPVAFTSPSSSAKLDSTNVLNLQKSSFSSSPKPLLSSAAGESKPPATTSLASTLPLGLSSPASAVSSKMPTVPTSTPAPGSLSKTTSDPTHPPGFSALNKTPLSSVTLPDPVPTSAPAPISSTKPQVSPAPPTPVSLDKVGTTTTPTTAPVSWDKKPPASPAPEPSPTPVSLDKIRTTTIPTTAPVSWDKKPPASPAPEPSPTPVSLDKIRTTTIPTTAPISLDKKPPASPAPEPTPTPISLDKICATTASTTAPVSLDKRPPAGPGPEPTPTPVSFDKTRPTTTLATAPVSLDKIPPAPTSTSAPTSHTVVSAPAPSPMPPSPAPVPISLSKTSSATTPALCPASSPAPSPASLLGEDPSSAKMKGSGQASVDGQLTSPSSMDTQRAWAIPHKAEETHNEPRTTPQGPIREKRTPPSKAPGVSKIPVVGGGRAGRLPVRDNQHIDDDGSWDPPTPVLEEERPQLHTQDRGSKDKISEAEASVPTSKHTQEESQPPHQPKVITSVPRDSKIPVKQGTQSHTVSQIPQAKEPPRTKIPVSKVPVRRIGNKPAGSSTQMRK